MQAIANVLANEQLNETTAIPTTSTEVQTQVTPLVENPPKSEKQNKRKKISTEVETLSSNFEIGGSMEVPESTRPIKSSISEKSHKKMKQYVPEPFKESEDSLEAPLLEDDLEDALEFPPKKKKGEKKIKKEKEKTKKEKKKSSKIQNVETPTTLFEDSEFPLGEDVGTKKNRSTSLYV